MSLRIPRQSKTIPIKPHVSVEEKQCDDCLHFIQNVDPAKHVGWCEQLNEVTTKYDECGAFDRDPQSINRTPE